MIVGNTTVVRPQGVRDRVTAREAGGFSGRPLFALATRMLAETYVRVEGAFGLVGVGGIDSGEAALAKIRGGRVLDRALQRAGVPRAAAGRDHQIRSVEALRREGCTSIDELVGADAAAITAQRWPT